jgi:hypothetical protein
LRIDHSITSVDGSTRIQLHSRAFIFLPEAHRNLTGLIPLFGILPISRTSAASLPSKFLSRMAAAITQHPTLTQRRLSTRSRFSCMGQKLRAQLPNGRCRGSSLITRTRHLPRLAKSWRVIVPRKFRSFLLWHKITPYQTRGSVLYRVRPFQIAVLFTRAHLTGTSTTEILRTHSHGICVAYSAYSIRLVRVGLYTAMQSWPHR